MNLLHYTSSAAFLLAGSITLSSPLVYAKQTVENESYNEFLDMDISQLMQVTITSVSKKPEALANAAAAVFVIRHEDIQRSGVTTIQDALRLAPGVQVARIGSDKWAVSTRGFNGRYANKLLVLMDGRTLYSPAFSGVYWEMQGTLLEDIDRIEVIRGPGATLWGANAVNGVINIITKKAEDTHGGLVRVGGGTEEEAQLGLRYGRAIGENVHARAYFTYDQRDSFELARDGSDAHDDWDSSRGGFRVDGGSEKKTAWTVQGDLYENSINQSFSPYFLPSFPYITELREEFEATGWNIMAKMNRKFANDSTLSAQIYYDFAKREESFLMQEQGTFDAEIQYQKKLGNRNDITTGVGYRLVDAEFTNSFQASILPAETEDITYSGFIQDAISVIADTLIFTLGTKWENNDYTGTEFQPSARILWKATKDTSVWAAVSRAVKVPSQFESNGSVVVRVAPDMPPNPAVITLVGNTEYDSEEVISYETGYRWFPNDTFSLDLALFYNDYDKLLDSAPNPLNPYESVFSNSINGNSYGAEVAITWKPLDWTKFDLAYSYINFDMDSSLLLPSGQENVYEGSAPQHSISLFSQLSLTAKLEMNVWLRYVDNLPVSSPSAATRGIEIDDYVDVDISISYQATNDLKLSLVGQNLLNSSNSEFISESFTAETEVERGVYLKALWSF